MDSFKLPFSFDADAMMADVGKLNQAWLDHFVKQNYQGQWQVVPLRGPVGASHPVTMMYSDPSCEKFEDTPFLKACPAIANTLAELGCELQAVRLMQLQPGSIIKRHRDLDLSIEDGTLRLHIPLQTHQDVYFEVNDKRVVMAAGECWYLNLSHPHAVENASPVPRIHLVVDSPSVAWLQQLIAASN